ncbi:hypothetical protein T11_11028 [Trichinella zimbabwensis]|uniref:DUF5641 domain-containing protein n=1 Tax=Trichinella zimbabwensis TaxID=268475 RepID=A0A0V1HKX3_9BILA|nr:hypothetical protein T11_11028 [Trichinella zimbabwensis]
MRLSGFDFKKWVSNHDEILASLPREGVKKENNSSLLKTLRVTRKITDDELSYPIPLNINLESADTKRQLISTTVKIFDPLGSTSSEQRCCFKNYGNASRFGRYAIKQHQVKSRKDGK